MSHSNNKILLSFIIFMIAFLVILGIFLKDVSYMMIFLILPSIIAFGIDRSTDKCLFISVSFFNLGGIIFLIAKLSAEITNISSPFIFQSTYMISFIGYLFFRLIPPMIQLFYLYLAKLNRMRSKNKIKLLKATWEITSY